MHKWGWQKIQRSVTTCFAPFFLHMLGFFTRVFFKLQPMKLASIVSFIKWLSYVLVQGWYVCVQPSFYSVVARTFFRVSQGVTFTAHLHLVPKLGMCGAILLLRLCALMTRTWRHTHTHTHTHTIYTWISVLTTCYCWMFILHWVHFHGAVDPY